MDHETERGEIKTKLLQALLQDQLQIIKILIIIITTTYNHTTIITNDYEL